MSNLDLEFKQQVENQQRRESAVFKATPSPRGESVPWPNLSATERLIVRRSHPRSLFINAVGGLWMIYFLARQDWVMALSVVVFFRALAYVSVWKCDPQLLAQTTLGKVALLHLHPVNLVVQVAGLIPMLYGVWQHNTELILGGLSLVLMGHLFGWSKLDRRLARQP